MPLPTVVIVGRPNVGKSSLLNWLTGRRIAIVDPTAGVTRDRVGALAQIGEEENSPFVELIDTGGIGVVDRDDLSEHVEKQIQAALDDADVVLFVVDVRDGLMPLDEEVARRLRYVDKPVVLVINKADDPRLEDESHQFHKLGRGTPVYVSTQQNRGKYDLWRLIAEKLPPPDDSDKSKHEPMKIAVVGRPNTGKSTFINTLAQAERMIVSEVPGTTRDSVDVSFELDGLPFVAIDTAGVRRKAKIRDDLDFYSLHRAERSIRRADVVFHFLDIQQGIARLDKQLADYVTKQFKPIVFVVNKWDLVLADSAEDGGGTGGRIANMVQHSFRTMTYAPLAFITAKTGKNVKALLNLGQAMYKQANKRISTSTLNKVTRAAVDINPPPVREGRTPKVYYATQVGVAPPTIVLFVNRPSLFDAPYQRYLLNTFRSKLPYKDIPIKMYLRARTQTDPSERGEGQERPTRLVQARGERFAVDELDDEVNDLLEGLEDE
jgi:GTPase